MRKLYDRFCQLLVIIVVCLFSNKSNSQPPTISYTDFITGLTMPIDLVNAGDGSNRLFIAQQNGVILYRTASPVTTGTFMNVGSSAGGLNLITTGITPGSERGLLSMVFHPDYNGTTNRYFFLYYTQITTGNIVISRFETVDGDMNAVDPSSQLQIISIAHPGFANHNGGKMNFGTDGYLYFATGDGGGSNDPSNNAQSGASLLGKMIRIDINNPVPQPDGGNYVIPADNPYVSDPAIRDEIWALGLRNPFRWSFDRANGNMWIGDVGQGAKEEINFRPAANTAHVNYGWDCYEGYISTPSVPDCDPVDYIIPVYDYDNPGSGSSAVTGGYVYRGSEYPNFQGYYIATDAYIGSVYFLWPNGSGGFDSSVQVVTPSPFIVGFGEAEDGTLYAVSQGSNAILKVVAAGGTPLPVRLGSFSVRQMGDHNELNWTTTFEEQSSWFHIEHSTNARNFTRVGQVAVSGNPNGNSYSFRHQTVANATSYYRLAVEDLDGSIEYSRILRVLSRDEGMLKIYPTMVRGGAFQMSVSKPVTSVQLINGNGSVVYEKNLGGVAGAMSISIPPLPKGVYIVQVLFDGEVRREKLVID